MRPVRASGRCGPARKFYDSVGERAVSDELELPTVVVRPMAKEEVGAVVDLERRVYSDELAWSAHERFIGHPQRTVPERIHSVA